jgi:hypothetical protein
MTQGHRRTRHAAGVFVAACSALVLGLAGAGSATAATTPTWLCKPGLANNPCTPGLRTTQVSPTGQNLKTFTPSSVKRPKVDCFYVYPTVSDQKAPQATKHIDPEERSIALYQAARYSSLCRIYAPMYRQITLQGLLNPASVTQKMRDTGYGDVRDAWRYYLKHYNKGRGVILISHSQGTFVLRTLVAKEIDKSAKLRKQLIAGVLLGGNVLVKKGKDVGGDFQHVRACRSATQLGCVIAFSTFNETPPANSLFGRTGARFGTGDPKGTEVLCTNPAALGGGSAPLNSVLPSAPFAPGTTIGALTTQIGFPAITAKTPWAEADGLYTGACSAEGGAHVLRINGTTPDAPVLRPLADATWGLHLTDANIALGNIITLVGGQAKAYLAKARTTR